MTGEIPMTYQQAMFAFTWYAVEFATYIAIIAYVLSYFGFLKVPKPAGNVVEEASSTWGSTGELLASAASIAKQVNKAFEPPDPKAIPKAIEEGAKAQAKK